MTVTAGEQWRLSMCVCTFRRTDGIRRALESLAECRKPVGVRAEIIVVDNDSAMSGKQACDAFQSSHLECQVKYVVEAVPGIAAARNRCLAEATGDWVTFI